MQEVYAAIQKFAGASHLNILITGESGTGKTEVAKALHGFSNRREKPFVTLNCAAIPDTLLEGEMFGFRKGAFTGAYADHKGRFEQASCGTLFLDEVGDMSPEVQKKLLLAVDERWFTRVMGVDRIMMDCRIVSATNKDLEKEVADGRFRGDLYYRLRGAQIHLPPLRARGNDVLLLAQKFVQDASRENRKHVIALSKRARELVVNYCWPGNVRELKNLISEAIVLAEENAQLLDIDHLGELFRRLHRRLSSQSFGAATVAQTADSPVVQSTGAGLMTSIRHTMKWKYIEALQQHKGNKSAAARSLGLSESTFRYRLKRCDID